MPEILMASRARPPIDPDTHWNLVDHAARTKSGLTTAVCGARVPERRISGTPTCPICAEACAAYDRLEME